MDMQTKTDISQLRIDGSRLWQSLMELGAIGATPKGGVCRLALTELDKEGEHERSLALLAALGKDGEPYVPAFFMAGQQLARLERYNEARAVLRDGIEQARRVGESHAAGEMSEFLANLGAAGE